MAHPGLGFLFLIGAGIAVAVGLIYAAANNQHSYSYANNSGGPRAPEPSNSWTTTDSEDKKTRKRRKSVDENDCSICYSSKCDYKLSCGHKFHLDCILPWVKVQKTCPNCRKSLDDTFLL